MKLLTQDQAAELLNISKRSLFNHTQPRGPIPVIRLGQTVRYDAESLREVIRDLQSMDGTSTDLMNSKADLAVGQ